MLLEVNVDNICKEKSGFLFQYEGKSHSFLLIFSIQLNIQIKFSSRINLQSFHFPIFLSEKLLRDKTISYEAFLLQKFKVPSGNFISLLLSIDGALITIMNNRIELRGIKEIFFFVLIGKNINRT